MMRTLFRFASLLLLPLSAVGQTLDLDQFHGMNMRNVGPAGMSGRVTTIDVVLDNPEIIYAGTASGGLWKSTSGGTTWQPIFDDQDLQSIGAVAVQQSNPDVVWAGTGEGNPRNSHTSGGGIYKSIDGGKSWKLMGLVATKNIHRIIIHRDDPNTIFVAALGSIWGANEERGVYRTKDGGKTWEKVLYANDLTGCADMITDPSNPNKIIAALWEYKRDPWFFKSGGKGSGLHVTFDGGDTWKKLTEDAGLPKGELGRIGISLCHSKPNVVYALVESKKTALYRSNDGGHQWNKVADKNIGNRPFYYADIYVDPQNENRLYNLHSVVTKSEDGGKTFTTLLPYYGVHPDHHAWWIHPENPDFLIDGNDGGLNISRDRGETWRFVENIPVGQFYHINIDDEVPYNIYGGMQDNGSWIGPAYVWQNGGIRNHHWQEVLFGDGFDVMPVPGFSRYGYAMYQGGNLNYYDAETGHTEFIQPYHPEGEPLRFNWNAALAQNPQHVDGIYFGSQYLHKSMDRGQSWEIISPDLTTNDTTKQQQAKSGGLTIDATRAENFTTITAIAPSPKDEQVIWVGTDDGRLHITKDGGKTWEDVYSRLKDLPAGAWIPQIVASPHQPGEAFVIVNDYRRDNWEPYAYHTKDYGKKWTRIASASKVSGHCHSIVQDHLAPNLLFLGTERGLYVTIDGGTNWTKWDKDYPSVATIDLKIHPREHDLVIGTFGRAAWVLDNISPLRVLAQKGIEELDNPLVAFPAPVIYIGTNQSAAGVRFHADAHFRGQNRQWGALIPVYVKEKVKEPYENAQGHKVKPDFMTVVVTTVEGDTVRNFKTKVKPGLNRVHWALNSNGFSYPGWADRKPDADPPQGSGVIPGNYLVAFQYGEHTAQTNVEVAGDPRVNMTRQQYLEYAKFMEEHRKLVDAATAAFDQLKHARKVMAQVKGQLQFAEKEWQDSIKNMHKQLDKQLTALESLYMNPKSFTGYDHVTERLNSHLFKPVSYVGSIPEKIGPSAIAAEATARRETEKVLKEINAFFADEWVTYKTAVAAASIEMFKDYEPIEIKE